MTKLTWTLIIASALFLVGFNFYALIQWGLY